jgi:carbon storage regulator CsrA
MLVLSRQTSESLTFFVRGVTFEVTVKEIRGNKVRLSTDANPADVRVVRSELFLPAPQFSAADASTLKG